MKRSIKQIAGAACVYLLSITGAQVHAGPVDGMKCRDGTVLDGTTGPERTVKPEFFCKMFPKHPWQYPPLGYGAKEEDRGVQFPFICDRRLGGYVYTNAGKPACPMKTPEAVYTSCLNNPATREIIRDMACVVRRDPAKLGRFLNNKNMKRNLIEFASFISHMGQETGDMRTIWENNGLAGQYCSYFHPGEDKYCSDNKFYGRGVHQLTHPSNYSDFSNYWYRDRTVLLKDPDLLLTDMEVSWGSAIWFWMEPRQHHNGDATCNKWSLMHEALFEKGLGFGETISTINGGIECSGGNSIGPWQRISRLVYFLDVLGVPMPWVTGGELILPSFFSEGCSWINQMRMVVKRQTWKTLEKIGGPCAGYNQPYPCGWGGISAGPSDIPNPLITSKVAFIKAPLCPVPWDKKPDLNSWPYNIAKDEGYHKLDDSGTTPEDSCWNTKMCYERCGNLMDSGFN